MVILVEHYIAPKMDVTSDGMQDIHYGGVMLYRKCPLCGN